jgi:thioredoxin-like negative regulator of GroEL
MRSNLWRGIVTAVLALCTFNAAHAAGGIRWGHSFSRAVTQARAANKLVMVDFYTDWCGWCKRLDATTYLDKNVVRLASQTVPVKLNAEREGLREAQKYGVGSFPTILFINGHGAVEDAIEGFMPPDGFAQRLEAILQQHRDIPKMESRLRANPGDADIASKLAIVYARQGEGARAVTLLTRADRSGPAHGKVALSKAYNIVGSMYMTHGQFNQALPLFSKVLHRDATPLDIAVAHMSRAVCYAQQKRPKAAVPELKAVLASPSAPERMKAAAQQALDQLKAQGR